MTEESNSNTILQDVEVQLELDTSAGATISDSETQNVALPPSSLEIQESSNPSQMSVFQVYRMEAVFCLKMMAKHKLSQEAVNDIMGFSNSVHRAKLEITKTLLQRRISDENISKVCQEIDMIDNIAGLNDRLATHYKRMSYIKSRFDFVEPRPIPIGKIRDKVSFYWALSIFETLKRLLLDKSVRKYIINDCTFSSMESDKKIYDSFSTGKVIQKMKLTSRYILLQLYLDAFGTNSAIGMIYNQRQF